MLDVCANPKRGTIGLWIVVVVLFNLVIGCSKPSGQKANVSFRLPPSSAVHSVSQKILTASSGEWGLTQATSYSEINCYAVMVNVPEATTAHHCTDASGAEAALPTIIKGGYTPNSAISVDMQSGQNRTIYLVGFKSITGRCKDFSVEFARRYLSAPVIVASTTTDIVPGDSTISLSPSLTNSKSFETCTGASIDFLTPKGGIDSAVTIVLPASTTIISSANQASLPFSGACSSNGSTVTLHSGTSSVGTATCSSGAWSISANLSSLANGTLSFYAEQSDANGVYQSDSISLAKDGDEPTVTLTSSAAATTSTSPIPVSVTFSESVTGFALSDITVTNGTASSLSGSGTSYTFNVVPTSAGAVTVLVVASAATDSVGNGNSVSSTLSRTFSTGSPAVTLTTTASSPTNSSSLAMTATFTDSVTGFIASDLTVTNGTISGFTGSGATYTFNVIPTAGGSVVVSVVAGVAQNAVDTNSASNAITVTYDGTAPTVTLSSSASTITTSSNIPVSVTFSESVTGFTLSDITVTNGTASGLAGSGSGYTFNVSASAAGPVTIAIAASAAQDSVGNNSAVSSTLTRTYSTGSPSTTLSTTATSPTNQTSYAITVAFSTAVTGFTSSDVSIVNGTLTNFAGSGASYSFDIAPSSNGSVSISVPASMAQTAAADANTASNTITIVYDSGAPTVTLTSASSSPINAGPIQVVATFSETVTGFDSTDLSLTNGIVSNFGGSGTTYTFDMMPISDGVMSVSVPASVAADSSSNTNTASSSLSRTYDGTSPSTVGGLTDAAVVFNSLSQSPSISWADASDAETGVSHYKIAIGTTPGSGDVLSWTAIGYVNSYQTSGLSLTLNQTYYASVKAVDVAGNEGSSSSTDGWYAQTQPIAAGGELTCVNVAGQARCWGRNSRGQVGDGTTIHRLTPVSVSGLADVTALSAAENHACGIRQNGDLYCWGMNMNNHLGDGTTTDRYTPVQISIGGPAVSIGTGYSFGCAVLANSGAVKCWGMNVYGQVGDGTNVGKSTPTDVSGLSSGASKVSLGFLHSCALTGSGGVKCWGGNTDGQLGNGTTSHSNVPIDTSTLGSGMRDVSSGWHHSCAVAESGAVKCWGDNDFGQLGDGTYVDRLTPVSVSGISTARSVVTGEFHSCALLTDNSVKCWGKGIYGQLGHGLAILKTSTAVTVSSLGAGAVAIASSKNHVCAYLTTGGVKCWGDNSFGQFGDGDSSVYLSSRASANGESGVVSLTAGKSFGCLINSSNALKCFGANDIGQLGDLTTEQRTIPTQVNGLTSGVTQVAAGANHVCAVVSGGVNCWGGNSYGELGDGTAVAKNTPTAVSGLSSVVQVAAGYNHSCALKSDYTISCWGANFSGQLGDATTTSRTTPVAAGVSGTITQVVTGFSHTCALVNSGVKCWGNNGYGQLGDNTTTARSSPVDVSGLTTGVSSIAAGGTHTCAVMTSGALKCWGRNNNGQLGNNSVTQAQVPVDTTGLSTGVGSVAVGEFHTCARMTSGTAKCWGLGFSGRLGDGTQNIDNYASLTPTTVSGVTTALQIAVGGENSCAVLADGTVACWGSNQSGQNGNQLSLTPTAAIGIP